MVGLAILPSASQIWSTQRITPRWPLKAWQLVSIWLAPCTWTIISWPAHCNVMPIRNRRRPVASIHTLLRYQSMGIVPVDGIPTTMIPLPPTGNHNCYYCQQFLYCRSLNERLLEPMGYSPSSDVQQTPRRSARQEAWTSPAPKYCEWLVEVSKASRDYSTGGWERCQRWRATSVLGA